MSIAELRAQINILDMKRKELVNNLIDVETDPEEKFDLWMSYSIKKNIPFITSTLVGEYLFNFIKLLVDKQVIKSNEFLLIEEITGLIYEECLNHEYITLSLEGLLLLKELMNRNIGTLWIEFGED